MTDLKQQWIHALNAAADALEAAARARILSVKEGVARRDRLAVERGWVEGVNWSAGGSTGATVTLLEAPAAKTVRTRDVKRAA